MQQVLQQGWDALTSETSEAQSVLESQLLQWSAFDDNLQLIERWLKDMRRKVTQPDNKADIGEKRAQLQKFKVGRLN